MNEQNDEKLRELLKEAVPPAVELQLTSDLWPQMLRRLEQRELRVSWMDWVLMGALVILLWFFPDAAATLLYQL
jgi:hypothetical protein